MINCTCSHWRYYNRTNNNKHRYIFLLENILPSLAVSQQNIELSTPTVTCRRFHFTLPFRCRWRRRPKTLLNLNSFSARWKVFITCTWSTQKSYFHPPNKPHSMKNGTCRTYRNISGKIQLGRNIAQHVSPWCEYTLSGRQIFHPSATKTCGE